MFVDNDYNTLWPDLPVKYLILATDEYIVFVDNENDLDWKTTTEFDNRTLNSSSRELFNKVCNEIARVECIPCDKLEESVVINFKRQLGEALVRNLDSDFVSANEMVGVAADYVITRNSEESRFLYLLASGATTMIVLFASVLLWLFRELAVDFLGNSAFVLGLCFSLGSLGAFLSIILRIGKVNMDFNAAKKLHYLEGSAKILAGMISALLVALCVKADLILSVFSQAANPDILLLTIAIISGASERLAPSIIEQIEGTKMLKDE